uniref:Lipoprotein n=1 Tax=viral metagenome TaxID=1070528 RepID=A0A6M3KQD4_9ZZZZ
MIRFIALVLVCLMLTGCSTVYSGFTSIRVKAKKFTAKCGPFNAFSGEDVDANFNRKMTMTGDKNRKIAPDPDIKMSDAGEDNTFEVVK